LTVEVILILIGVAVQPSIATIQPEEEIEVECFDVITEFIGLEKSYTTQLTKEEIKRLDDLFDSISNNLNKSESYENSIDIFKEAIIELNSFGLLGDIGIDEAEKLVTNYYQNPKNMKTFKRVYNRDKGDLDDINIFCLIAGEAVGIFYSSPIVGFITRLMWIFFAQLPGSPGFFGFLLLFGFTNWMVGISDEIKFFIPFSLTSLIIFEKAYGEITTFGLLGRKYWEGKLVGKLYSFWYEHVGVIGFTGIKIQIWTYPNGYYIGSAPLVHIKGSYSE